MYLKLRGQYQKKPMIRLVGQNLAKYCTPNSTLLQLYNCKVVLHKVKIVRADLYCYNILYVYTENIKKVMIEVSYSPYLKKHFYISCIIGMVNVEIVGHFINLCAK